MERSFEALAEIAGALVGAYNTASSVKQTLNTGGQAIQDAYEKQIPSLTQYTKPFNIMSRMYIEQSIANDDIALPIVSMLNQLYCSYVISALNLNGFVSGGRTIRNLLKLVSTEQYIDVISATEAFFDAKQLDKPILSMESSVINLDPDSQRLLSGRVIELDLQLPATTVTEMSKGPVTGKDAEGKPTYTGPSKSTTVTSGGTVNAKLVLYVQLIPYIIPKDVVDGFLSLNFSPAMSQRWRQLKAGEISFWKDFVLAKDIVARETKAIKTDKNNVLYDMLAKSHSSLAKHYASMAGVSPERHNLANTLLIVDKRSFQTSCAASGIDFKLYPHRRAFFDKSYVMIVVVVDTMYNMIEMYFNGIEERGEYPYAMVNKLAKGKDSFDLKEIMTAFSQGMTPKF